MAKFKVNQIVLEKESGKLGIIRAKEVDKKEKHTDVKYLVDFRQLPLPEGRGLSKD